MAEQNMAIQVMTYDPTNPGGTATKGYINYYGDKASTMRTFTKGELESEKNYLRAIPSAQITA